MAVPSFQPVARLATALALCLVVSASAGDDLVQLRYQLEPGTVWMYQARGEGKGRLFEPHDAGGGSQPWRVNWEARVEQKVLAGPDADGAARLSLRIPTMRATLSAGEAVMMLVLDRDGIRQSLNGRSLLLPEPLAAPPLNGPLDLRLTPTGRVIAPGPPGAPAHPDESIHLLADLLPDFRQWYVQFPERGVSPGDAWEQERELALQPGEPPLRIRLLNRLLGWQMLDGARCAHISLAAVPAEPEAGRHWRLDGMVWFNPEAGRVERLRAEISSRAGDESTEEDAVRDEMEMQIELRLAEQDHREEQP